MNRFPAWLTTRALDSVNPAPENPICRIVHRRLKVLLCDKALAGTFALALLLQGFPFSRPAHFVSTGLLLIVVGMPMLYAAFFHRLLRPLGPGFFAAPIEGRDLRQGYTFLFRASVLASVSFAAGHWIGVITETVMLGAEANHLGRKVFLIVFFFPFGAALMAGVQAAIIAHFRRWGSLSFMILVSTLGISLAFGMALEAFGLPRFVYEIGRLIPVFIFLAFFDKTEISDEELVVLVRNRTLRET